MYLCQWSIQYNVFYSTGSSPSIGEYKRQKMILYTLIIRTHNSFEIRKRESCFAGVGMNSYVKTWRIKSFKKSYALKLMKLSFIESVLSLLIVSNIIMMLTSITSEILACNKKSIVFNKDLWLRKQKYKTVDTPIDNTY